MGTKGRGGEIVQVEGGHILRSVGRKDRHSKVYTAKGPRDRRVRLSAHTAIQFYDVQDRLGYDRPSKAVDWLINKAKTAIDKLEELPPWNPMVSQNEGPNGAPLDQRSDPSSGYPFHGDAIDDTMKSFFPISSGMDFQSYPEDIMSRTSLQIDNQDLCLSLHAPPADHCLFPAAAPANFEGNYPRMVGWDGEIKPGFFIDAQTMAQPNMLCQQNLGAFSQREPLQSSFSPLVRAWNDLPLPTSEHNNTTQQIHHFSVSNTQFGSDRFSGFQVPARIHGEEPSSGSANSHQ